ncbi:MAG: hypothetical protein LLF94_02215 [Chlamydiales bacterium]|nr:hypothetical protein [Chlamydiales bacterium]
MNTEFLFYKGENRALAWSHKPPGNLSVERLIIDEACWQQEFELLTKNRRTLVLTDFAFMVYKEYELDRYIQGLHALLDAGFTVYVWREKRLILLDNHNIFDQDLRAYCKETGTEGLSQALAEENKEIDTVAILDYIACRRLFFNEQIPELGSHLITTAGTWIVERALEKLALDQLVAVQTNHSDQLQQLTQKFTNLSLGKKQLRQASVRFDDLKTFMDNEELKFVEKLMIYNSIATVETLGILSKFLQRRDTLKKLELTNCKIELDFTDDLNLKNIEYLELRACKISQEPLKKIFLAAPKLRHLHVVDCSLLDEEVIHCISLHTLETVYVQRSDVLPVFIREVLTKSSLLCQLQLLAPCTEYVAQLSDADFDSLQLTHLRTLNLCSLNTIGAKLFAQILAKAPNLLHVEAKGIDYTPIEKHVLEIIDLRRLKSLELYMCTLGSNFYKSLFGSLASLTMCRILSSTCKEEDLTYQKREASDTLGNLKELTITYSCLPCRFIEAIFERAYRLEKIHLAGPSIAQVRSRRTSQYVKEIECRDSDISLPFLQTLLSSSAHLRTLLLLSCQNLTGSFDECIVKKMAFDALTDLDVGTDHYCSNLSADAFTQIVKKAPNIEKLRFGFEEIEPIELHTLKELNLSNAAIGIENFLLILEQAPNLEKLDVAYCRNLHGPVDEEMLQRINTHRLLDVRHSWLPSSIINRFSLCSPQIDISCTHRYVEPSAPHEIEDIASSYTVSMSKREGCGLHAKRIFEGKGGDHPAIRFYRLRVYDSLSVESLPFVWSQSKKIKLTPCSHSPIFTKTKQELDLAWDRAHQEEYRFYLATYDMPAEKEWLPLPSYLSDELITYIYADGEILYSESENFYYLKLRPGDKRIYYIIKVPEPLSIDVLDSDIVKRITHYQNTFEPEELDLSTITTSQEFFLEVARQQCGACRYRAPAFFHELRQQFGHIEARLEQSEIHDFIAIKHESRWVRCDLGGSAANLSIDEKDHAILSQKSLHVGSGSKISLEDYCFKHILRPGRKTLIQVHSKQDLVRCKDFITNIHRLHLVDTSVFDEDEMAHFVQKNFSMSECVVGLYILGGYSFTDQTKKFTDFWHETVTITFDEKTKDPLKPSFVQNQGHVRQVLEQKMLEVLFASGEERAETFTFNANQSNCNELVQKVLIPGKNVHVGFCSEDELDLCAFWLQQHISETYYIDTPSDIRCASRWIDDSGHVQTVPGGPLFTYLTTCKTPVIIINFHNFRARDLVRCNSIIDTQYREADGQIVPPNSTVIGLFVVGPDSYNESDLMGRFYEKIRVAPFSSPYPIAVSDKPAGKVVDLYGKSCWKEPITGTWQLQGDHCVRKRGPLEKGYSELEIRNGPWHERGFRHFWMQKSLTHTLKLSKSEGVNWDRFQDTLFWIDSLPEGVVPFLLNTSTFSEMKTQYELENRLLHTIPGVVYQNRGKSLFVILTSSLGVGHWYRLLDLCKKQNVRLHVLGPAGFSSPLGINDKPVKLYSKCSITSKVPDAYDKMLYVTDRDSGLVTGLQVDVEDSRYRFERRAGAIQKFLDKNEHVVLMGSYNQNLVDALMPFLVHGVASGKLTIVTESEKGFELFHSSLNAIENNKTLAHEPLSFTIDPQLHPIDQNRLQLVYEALNRDYHVVIEGETGVGKTTFIKEVLAKQQGIRLCYTLYEFSTCPQELIPLLFVDEVDMQIYSFEYLEGLYFGGLIDEHGIYYPTTSRHRVIFCKNPKEYGGERKEVPFLKRHPNRVSFTALPIEYLAAKYGVESELIEIWKKVPELTPRELEMMSLMPDRLEGAYQIAKCALAKSKQQAFTEWFYRRFTFSPQPVTANLGTFILTESRHEIYRLMTNLLSIRKKRVKGGLGGLVLEGMPGDGKSHFAEAVLAAHGLQKVQPHEIGTVGFDAYCKIPAGMDVEDKRACLLAAFHSGQVVLEEENNASSPSEALHNALLMGYDEEMNSAQKEGFFVIRTQNPISMRGRRAASKADKHRVLTYQFSPCPQKEIYQIVKGTFPGLSDEIARLISRKKMSVRELLRYIEKSFALPKKILNPLPNIAQQKGPTCKLYALAAVISQFSPVSPDSLIALAKNEHFSKVGEIYDPEYLVQLAKNYGFASAKAVQCSSNRYIETLKELLDSNHAPIVFFDVDPMTGAPVLLKSLNEHAAVCVGYFLSMEDKCYFTLVHWGTSWVVSADDLAASADNLSHDRSPETFYKVEGIWRTLGDRTDLQNRDLEKTLASHSYDKKIVCKSKPGTTFRNTFITLDFPQNLQ